MSSSISGVSGTSVSSLFSTGTSDTSSASSSSSSSSASTSSADTTSETINANGTITVTTKDSSGNIVSQVTEGTPRESGSSSSLDSFA